MQETQTEVPEPPRAFWQDLSNYDQGLQQSLLVPLQKAIQDHGHVPQTLQRATLQHLHWYFTVDARERAPTVVVKGDLMDVFHNHVRQIMGHIDRAALDALDANRVSPEIRQALLSYQNPHLCTPAVVDAYDHEQGLARLTYFVHGDPPPEGFVVDGKPVKPAYCKYRACNYYSRRLLRQRIVWLPIAGATALEMTLNGVAVPVALGTHPQQALAAAALLPAARVAYPPGKGGQQPLPTGWAGWKVRLMKAMARFPLVRHKFAKAWVFLDREEDADDNAEHLYRWVRKHHPEVNAWFLLTPDSSDWARLQAEGFRLVPPGLKRKLLILNCDHIISSHAELVFGGFDRALYGDAMQWRYTFLQHGVIKDDISHWLGPREFDCFVTSSPAEHQSVVGDDTAYQYTEREVKRTGLPRFDHLRQLDRSVPVGDKNILLFMPTWRSSLVDERSAAINFAEKKKAIAESEYVRHWRAALADESLRDSAIKAGVRLVFLPHPNAVPFLDAFELPTHIEIATKSKVSMQEIFARSIGFVTDYTSVAFDIAFLRKPVFYYQFDRKNFYGGDHNWRIGYFDYERDGFGPVRYAESDLLAELQGFLESGCQAKEPYLERMVSAMPEYENFSCQKVCNEILKLHDYKLPNI